MKGYITNKQCYIFPQTAAEIPTVEADVFYVQEENYAAWLEENESLADKLVKYNYNTMTVNPKVWAGHEDDDLEPAQKEDPELAWSAGTATAQIGETNTYPTLSNPHSVTVRYASRDTDKATIDASTGEITLLAEGETTIMAAFDGDDTYEAQSVTYELTVQAAAPTTYTITFTGDYAERMTASPSPAEEDATVTVTAESGFEVIELTSEDVEITRGASNWTFTMPAEDVTIATEDKTITLTFDGAALSNVDLTNTDTEPIIENPYTTHAGGGVVFNAKTGYTFDKEDTENTVLAVYNGATEVTPETWTDGSCWYGEQNTSLGIQTFDDYTFTVSAYTPPQ